MLCYVQYRLYILKSSDTHFQKKKIEIHCVLEQFAAIICMSSFHCYGSPQKQVLQNTKPSQEGDSLTHKLILLLLTSLQPEASLYGAFYSKC